MPTPGEKETEQEFVDRCIPIVIAEGTAKDGAQASAICHSMWDQHKEKKESAMYVKLEEIERRCLPRAEIRLTGKEGSRKIHGYAAVFDVWADIGGWFRESVRKGAFAKTIKENDVRALLNHDPNYVLARNKSGTLKLREDSKGLQVEIDPVQATWANDLLVSMERGDVNQMSFGFTVNKQQIDYERDERVLEDVTLFDVSVVTYPAYPTTSAEVRSAFARKHISRTDSTPALAFTITEASGTISASNATWEDTTTPGFSELDRIVRKIKAKEELTEEEVRLVSAYLPDLSTPPAKHVETPPEPPAKHSAGDTRKGSVADLLIRTAVAVSQPSRKEVAT